MPLKYGEVNPLVVFGLRRMTHMPPHFEPIFFDNKGNDKIITDWVWENLDGRFFYGDHYSTASNGSIVLQKVIAFEEKSEASYFGLMLSTINNSSGLQFI
jgi:hypothetical protein